MNQIWYIGLGENIFYLLLLFLFVVKSVLAVAKVKNLPGLIPTISLIGIQLEIT